jgi:hypothetical protein
MELAPLYTQWMIKEYRLALDLAVNALQGAEGMTLASVDSPRWGLELTRRMRLPAHFYPIPGFDVTALIESAKPWAQVDLDIFTLNTHNRYTGILWAFPANAVVNDMIENINQVSSDGATLSLISPGWLQRYLPEAEQHTSPTGRYVPIDRVTRLLKQSGWALHTRCGLHGIRSMLYSVAARVASALGRPDWQDRLIFTARSVYQERGLLWQLSTVIVSTFHKVTLPTREN